MAAQVVGVEDVGDKLFVLSCVVEEIKLAGSNAELEIVRNIQLLSQYISLEDSVLYGLLSLSKETQLEEEQQSLAKHSTKFNMLGCDFQETWPERYWDFYNRLRGGEPMGRKFRKADLAEHINEVVDLALTLNRLETTRRSIVAEDTLIEIDNLSRQYELRMFSKAEEEGAEIENNRCSCLIT